MHRHEKSISAGTMRQPSTMPRTFDELSISDLESVYGQGKEEVLRGHAFRILLSRHDSVEKLERLAFLPNARGGPESDPDLGAGRSLRHPRRAGRRPDFPPLGIRSGLIPCRKGAALTVMAKKQPSQSWGNQMY